jgi:nucleotide-binding universal stress UspA family protein
LHVVHIVSTAPEMPYPHPLAKERSEALLEAKKLHGLTLLDKRVGWIEKIGGRVKASHYREGSPDEQVIRLGQELDVGLVIVAGRKLNWFERTFTDNLSERLVRRANRPVMVVREPVERKSKAPDRQ